MTREHLAILNLLEYDGVIVISKADLVDEEFWSLLPTLLILCKVLFLRGRW